MTLIIDASIAVKWFIREDRAEAARALIGEDLGAPDLILAEAFNAVRRRLRGQADAHSISLQVLPTMRRAVELLKPSGLLLDLAAHLALHLDHAIYDCFYIALAQQEGMPLVTADERQFAAARKARIDARLL